MESLIAGLQPKSAHAENHAQVNQKNMRTIKACFHHYGNKKEAQTIQRAGFLHDPERLELNILGL